MHNIYHFAGRNPIDLVHSFNEFNTIAEKGVVTGCNAAFEWMLKWWWSHYSKHNNYPVVFADAGLSPPMRKWCLERGSVLSLASNPLLRGDDKDKVFGIEHGWKPFAPLFAPFERIAWIDLDCEITGDIGNIFNYANKLSLARDPFFHATSLGKKLRQEKLIPEDEQFYNSGVVVARQGSWLLKKWAELTICGPIGWRHSDQHILQKLVYQNPELFEELPATFNTLAPFRYTAPANSLILHRLASHPHTLKTLQLACEKLSD